MAAKKDTAPKTAAPAADKKAALETALALTGGLAED